MNVRAQQDDTVDELCWRHYGNTAGVTEAVYAANPGLCDGGPRLSAGQIVYLPELPPLPRRETVQLWD